MAKKNKNELTSNNIETENKNEFNEANENAEVSKTTEKKGYRIILKNKTFIIIDKYGINVRINLPIQELVKYKEGDLYYL